MRAGPLRHRVTIQDKSVTQNEYGEEVITWTELVTLWASVEPLRGREFIEVTQWQADVSTRIRTRFYSGVSPEMRAVHDSRTYEIVHVINPLEIPREMELMCREAID